MSNAACDEITERLIDVLNENEMYRFYAKSYKHERISPRIKRVSNYTKDGIFYPSLAFLYKFRVFIYIFLRSLLLSIHSSFIDHVIVLYAVNFFRCVHLYAVQCGLPNTCSYRQRGLEAQPF